MQLEEYDITFRVEDRHWWYRGLRAILLNSWRRFVTGERPRLLDIGCGTGANLMTLSGFSSPVGVDFSHRALALCQTRTRGRASAKAATPIPLMAGSALALPLKNSSFDVAIMMDVLCHKSINDKALALREGARILKPGGLFFLNVPAYQWLFSSHDVHVHTDKRFTAREVATLLRTCAFEPIHVTYWNTLLFPALAATRLLRKVAPPPGSDLGKPPGAVANAIGGVALSIERQLMCLARMPFGLSVFAVARKPGP
jgi:ubiquinone/menaquinone biosynthesis C-methylase UbiE